MKVSTRGSGSWRQDPHAYRLVPTLSAHLPEAAVHALSKRPGVAHIEADGRVRVADELSDAWGVQHIQAGVAHARNVTGTGVRVAVIDTGIDYNHPDLLPNYAGGWDFVNDDNDPMDDHGHGTHVAGTVAVVYNDVGVVGVAPTWSFMLSRCLTTPAPAIGVT